MIYWSAFIIGLVGSLHCLGMCGPIVLVLPGSVSERMRFFFSRILYNLGRAITYAFMGLVIGLIGESVSVAGYQQWLGIAAGVLMIFSVILPSAFIRKFFPSGGLDRVMALLKEKLGKLLGNSSQSSLFTIGLLNGFLPCGLVYMALAGSIAAGSIGGSALYMFIFGLGTLPLMLAAAYATNFITLNVRRKITKYIPVGVIILGVLFILRGLALGIPFISPDMDMMLKKGDMKKQEVRLEQTPLTPEEAMNSGCCGG